MAVADGKSRPLVRMFITRSSRSQAPRRRRRPKINIDNNSSSFGSPPVMTSATESSVAAVTSPLCVAQRLKLEQPSTEVYISCTVILCPCLCIGRNMGLARSSCRPFVCLMFVLLFGLPTRKQKSVKTLNLV